MEQLEKVEKLREKANVSYEEAKEALEASNWDILDAMVYLEKAGKVNGPKVATYYTTGNESNSNSENFSTASDPDATTFGEILGKFFAWCGKVIKKGCENSFQIERSNEAPILMPVIALVGLIVVLPWITLPLIVIGLFLGFRYSFKGPDLDRKSVNDFMDKASATAETIKDDFKSGSNKDNNEKK